MKSLFLSSLLALGLLAVPAQAAEYPAKPITLMTAFNAGGGFNTAAATPATDSSKNSPKVFLISPSS